MRPGVGLLVQAFAGAGEVREVAGFGFVAGAGVAGVDEVYFSVGDVRGVEVGGDLLEDFVWERC